MVATKQDLKTMDYRHSQSRKLGTTREYSLLHHLWEEYPSLKSSITKAPYGDVYDILSPFVLLDCVGLDKRYRLIANHKSNCKSHITMQKETGIPGMLAFLWNEKYYYLPVTSRILKQVKSPVVSGKLLSQCVELPIDKWYHKSSHAPQWASDWYIEIQEKKILTNQIQVIQNKRKLDEEKTRLSFITQRRV